MFSSVARSDESLIGRWWWSVDRWTLGALFILICIGALLSFAASPAIAQSNGLGLFSLAQKHLVFLPIATAVMLGVSMLSVRQIRLIAMGGLLLTLVVLVALPFVGNDYNGATRWISVAGISLQPSEFAKPCFALTAAWLIAKQQHNPELHARLVAFALYAVLVGLLIIQPDVGQTALVTAIFFAQLFLAGLPLTWIAGISTLGLASIGLAYWLIPHVHYRINLFLSGDTSQNYQVSKSLSSFANGGLFGKGPGEGEIKASLPDAHADFVFAVLGEEFGLIACFLVLVIIAFVVFQGLSRAMSNRNLFIVLAIGGLLTQFGLQAFVNMATSLNLIPTKGMTLPFISYGGSSMMATGLAMGFLLALTRQGAWESMTDRHDAEMHNYAMSHEPT